MPDQRKEFYVKNVTTGMVQTDIHSLDYEEMAQECYRMNLSTFGNPEYAVSYGDGTLVKRNKGYVG